VRIVESILAHAITQGLAVRAAANTVLAVSSFRALHRDASVNLPTLVSSRLFSFTSLTHLVSTRPTVVLIGEQIGAQSVDGMDVAGITETGAVFA
jgi:hypothetical protein